MYAVIAVDLIKALDENRAGELVINNGGVPDAGSLNVYRALDDDRIPYYIVIADDEGIERFFDFEMNNTGVTIIQEAVVISSSNSIAWKDALN